MRKISGLIAVLAVALAMTGCFAKLRPGVVVERNYSGPDGTVSESTFGGLQIGEAGIENPLKPETNVAVTVGIPLPVAGIVLGVLLIGGIYLIRRARKS